MNIKPLLLLLNLILTTSIFAQSQLTDIDGNTYKTVIIGNQEWMAENLKVEHYRNGDVIQEIQMPRDWEVLTTGAWCEWANFHSEFGITYGKLYNWFAVNDSRGLAPKGWHVPNDAEWDQLTNYLGGDAVAGGKMKAMTLWKKSNEGATNSSGFTALPGGFRNYNGLYKDIGEVGIFWSASEYLNYYAWYHILNDFFLQSISHAYGFRMNGYSVRCVKD